MDSPPHEQHNQPSSSDGHPVSNTACTLKMLEKVAWPVADKMLHLISQKSVPSGFDPDIFVKNSFLETFGEGLHQGNAGPASQRDTLGRSAKRKRCSVVDSALGIMGYDSLKVCDIEGSFLVDMLTSLIESKSSCGPICNYLIRIEEPNSSLRSRMSRGQFCARRIPVGVLLQTVDNCRSFFASVRDDGTKVQEVVDTLVKLATETCSFSPRAESVSGVFNKAIYEIDGQKRTDNLWALQSVIDFALEQKRSIYSNLRPCSRLRFWRIHPSCLKQDISSLANEAMLRLLLPLDREFCQRQEWAILVICLSFAPEMFMEARRLLHHWLISSGAVRLWELRAELVAAVWDVINHPSVWGLKDDIHLPPKSAFYCVPLRPFVQILEEPPTILGMLRLLKLLTDMEKLRHEPVVYASGQRHPLLSCNHNSTWSLLIEFLPWFLFASKLLFTNLKPTSTSTFRRDMCESLVHARKREGVIFESEDDIKTLCVQVAARYLAWIISPGDRLQRSSDQQMLLLLNSSWVKIEEGLCCGTCLPLSVQHDYGALKAAVQVSCIKCTRCGCPVKDVKTLTNEGVDGVCGKEEAPNNCSVESLLTLKLWLARVQRNFEAKDSVDYAEEKKCDGGGDASRMGPSSTTNSARKRSNFMAHFLPLAAVSESLKNCNLGTVVSVLQFVISREGDSAYSSDLRHEAEYETRARLLPECNSCKALRHAERCRLHDREGRAGATSSSEDKKVRDPSGGSHQRPWRSPDWISGVAVLFSILESLDEDVLLLVGCGPSLVDPTGDKGRLTCNLAVIVAEFVKEWASSLQAFACRTSSLEEDTMYKATLRDMHCRFCRWIDKLSLSSQAAKLCNDTKEALTMRMKYVKSPPHTP